MIQIIPVINIRKAIISLLMRTSFMQQHYKHMVSNPA